MLAFPWAHLVRLNSQVDHICRKMIYLTVWSLLALTALTSAGGLGGDPIYAPGYSSLDYYAYPRYAFEYAVKDPSTGDNKAQWERRDGDVVKGAYSLVEPDGSLRVVDYWADDKSGFNAVVKRVGPNLHPVTVPAIAPIYKAPIPVLSQGLGPIAPLAIGSISKYPGLSSAPLISGPYGGAISTASLIKATPVPVPVIPAAPIATTGLLPPGPLLPGPVWSSPVVKAVPSPVISGPLINPGLLSPGPSLAGPLYNPIGVPALKGGLNLSPLQWGNPGLSPIGYPSISPLGPWGGLGKGDLLGPGPIGDLGLYEKGPLLSGPIGNPWLGGIKGY